MVYLKTIKRKRKDGTVKEHYYLAKNYRSNGTIVTHILKPINKEEAQSYKYIQSLKPKKRKINSHCISCNLKSKVNDLNRLLSEKNTLLKNQKLSCASCTFKTELKKTQTKLTKAQLSYKVKQILNEPSPPNSIYLDAFTPLEQKIIRFLDNTGWITCRDIIKHIHPDQYISGGLYQDFRNILDNFSSLGYLITRIIPKITKKGKISKKTVSQYRLITLIPF